MDIKNTDNLFLVERSADASLDCCVLGLMLFVGNGPDRCACYPSAHNILHVSLTVYFPVVLPLFKMCHFIVLISLPSLGSGI